MTFSVFVDRVVTDVSNMFLPFSQADVIIQTLTTRKLVKESSQCSVLIRRPFGI